MTRKNKIELEWIFVDLWSWQSLTVIPLLPPPKPLITNTLYSLEWEALMCSSVCVCVSGRRTCVIRVAWVDFQRVPQSGDYSTEYIGTSVLVAAAIFIKVDAAAARRRSGSSAYGPAQSSPHTLAPPSSRTIATPTQRLYRNCSWYILTLNSQTAAVCNSDDKEKKNKIKETLTCLSWITSTLFFSRKVKIWSEVGLHLIRSWSPFVLTTTEIISGRKFFLFILAHPISSSLVENYSSPYPLPFQLEKQPYDGAGKRYGLYTLWVSELNGVLSSPPPRRSSHDTSK